MPFSVRHAKLFATAFIAVLLSLSLVVPQALSNDAEGTELRDLNTHCPFNPPATLADWQARAEDLRLQLNVSLGLHPKLELDPVTPEIYGKIDRDDYSIEKVLFESLPGFYVTGSLYRPKEIHSNVPGILCPHGHWTDARFYRAKSADVKTLLATGAERFENAAINHIQARCVQLARMGCIVFQWDMIGACDSVQISYERAHRFAKQPEEQEVKDDGWLLFSPRAESNAQSVMGLQALATQRAVDMLLSLPEIDASRIAITGASGGGTQSFVGAALDPRIKVAFPAVMVSTGMQGGCTCENACMLRTGTGNVEIAGLIAPRPLGLSAANDWTKHMETDGYPELRKLYQIHKATDKVALFPAIHFGHNFNHVSRTSMYGWMNEHLQLGSDSPVLERDFELANREDLTVWDSEHPIPPQGPAFERQLMKMWAEIVDGQMDGLLLGDQQQVKRLHETLHAGWKTCLGLTAPSATNHVACSLEKLTEGDHPSLLIRANESFSTVKFSNTSTQQELVANPRLAAAYTFGYNSPVFAKRAQALAHTLAELLKKRPSEKLSIHGNKSDAALAAASVFCLAELTEIKLDNVELKLDGCDFRFADVKSIRDMQFLPGSAKYLDLPGLVACLPVKTFVQCSDPSTFERLQPISHLAGGKLTTNSETK